MSAIVRAFSELLLLVDREVLSWVKGREIKGNGIACRSHFLNWGGGGHFIGNKDSRTGRNQCQAKNENDN